MLKYIKFFNKNLEVIEKIYTFATDEWSINTVK